MDAQPTLTPALKPTLLTLPVSSALTLCLTRTIRVCANLSATLSDWVRLKECAEPVRLMPFYPVETRADEICSRLVGGCDEIHELLAPDEMDDGALHAAIAEQIARCGICQVWEELPNLDDAGHCPDCERIPSL